MLANFVVSLSFSLPSVFTTTTTTTAFDNRSTNRRCPRFSLSSARSVIVAKEKKEHIFFLVCAFLLIGANAVEQKKKCQAFPQS